MGLFDRFRKKNIPIIQENGLLLAMPMFNNAETFNHSKLINYLKDHWNTIPSNIEGNDVTLSFTLEGETLVLGTLDVQIPWNDIEMAAEYAYNWPTATEDLKNHNSHVIVTMMTSNGSQLERYTTFSKVLASLIATSNCIGIYQGSQTLLIPATQYLKSAELLKETNCAIDLWIYIGLRKTEAGNNAYTYGLADFGKLEMEFINSNLSFEELYDFLINICAYLISSNITLKNSETLGYTANQKVKITQSKGLFTEGQTLKLEL